MEFINYGDVNLLDEGGTLVGKTYPKPDPKFKWQDTTYTVIRIDPDPKDEEMVYAGYVEIDVKDYREKDEIYSIYGLDKDCDDEEFAFAVVGYYGLVNLSASAFNNPYACYSMDIKAYRISKDELKAALKDIFAYEV